MFLQALMPDLVLINGNVLTVDDDFSITEAVAVKNGRILAVGTNSEIQTLIGEATKILDLKGKTMLPGIIDSHLHLTSLATVKPPLSIDVSHPAVTSIKDVVIMRIKNGKAHYLKTVQPSSPKK